MRMILPKTLTHFLAAHLRRSDTADTRLFPDMQAVWLVTLLACAIVVVISVAYGVFAVRSLDRLEAIGEEQDIPRRLTRLIDERLLHATRVYLDDRATSHQELLESPLTPVVDPAR